MGNQRSAIVVGGGIIGATSAYALARRGWRVQLIDREAQAAQGASLGNGRQLSYSHTNALASPAILREIPRLVLGCDEAFKLRLKVDRAFLSWILQFLGNCTSAANRKNTLETLELADRSRAAMEQLLEQHPIEFERRQTGKLVLLRSQAELNAARASLEMKRLAGLVQAMLSYQEACFLEPALEQAREIFLGALYAPDDETGNCAEFARNLIALCEEQFGVEFHTLSRVIGVDRKCGRSVVVLDSGEERQADLVVMANGHAINQFLEPLGHRLPIQPMKGYSFTAPVGNWAPRVSVTDQRRRIVFTSLGDRVLVAGIAELGTSDTRVDQLRLQSVIAAARASLPEAAVYSEADSGWAGLRPMTPNSRPITCMLEPGIAVNAGHGMLGWTLAMGSAEKLCEVVESAT
jgi:D-amino-acid dehydrogenase